MRVEIISGEIFNGPTTVEHRYKAGIETKKHFN